MRFRFALAAWSNRHFDQALFPVRTPHAEYLPRYATKFDCVEADILHHQDLTPAELRDWIDQTPEGFLFLPKMSKQVTHTDDVLPLTDEQAVRRAKEYLAMLEPLREAGRLGPVLLQFPPELARDAGAPRLEALLRLAEPGTFAVEVRNTTWFTEAFESRLSDFDACLVWSTFPKAFAPPWATTDYGYVRFTGKQMHVRGRHVTAKDRLADILEVRKRLAHVQWDECFVVVTNPFEGNAVDSLPRIAAALEGPDMGRRFGHEVAQPLFPDAPTGGPMAKPPGRAPPPRKGKAA